MSKEMQLLNSKMEFYKHLLYVYEILNFKSDSNLFDYKVEEYQDKITEVYKRIQELKEERKYD